MYLNRFTISNYKCFNEPVELTLKHGINLIVGKNNSGKSALLEALSMNAGASAHQSYNSGGEVHGSGPTAADKIEHSVALADWLLLNSSASLKEIADLISESLAGRPVNS